MLTSPDATTAMSIAGAYDDVFQTVDLLRPGMGFIDVGANAGVFSLVAGLRVGSTGSVLAFEPSPPVFRLLTANAQLNKLTNFFPFNAAIGGCTGLFRFNPASPSHTGGAHLDPHGSLSVLQLGPDHLTTLIPLLIGDRETLVKIDVEGSELTVLAGLRKVLTTSTIRRIVIEISPRALASFGTQPSDIYDEMIRLGFRAAGGFCRSSSFHNELFER